MVVTLYTFTTGDGTYQIRWDNLTPAILPFVFFKANGFGTEQSTVSSADFGYNPFDYVTSACSTDVSLSLVTFTASFNLNTPFLDIDVTTPNSPVCGYSTVSNLSFTSVVATDCTTSFNNNGIITAIATTNAGGLLYSLDNVNFQSSGVFSNLIPGTYTVYAKDNTRTHIYVQVTIFKFHISAANEKYEVSFITQKDNKQIQLKIYDTQNTFATPIFLTANGNNPIEKVYQNNNENKYTPIIAASVTVNLISDGLFSPNEFTFSDERRWKAHIYIDGALDFQGWVIADEIQDLYMDNPYNYQLVLTDGVSSLKGVPFTDLNGIRIFGITQLIRIWQYCFANLGYDIGTTILISSLTIRQASDIIDQWDKTLIWSDQFYDQDGIPDDFYTVLEKTLVAFGLTLFQHNGSFVMMSNCDIYHNVTGYVIHFDKNFTTPVLGGSIPSNISIGGSQSEKPVNPSQTIRFDKAISILNGNVDFTSLALLNQDPSFEYGNVQGALPVGWTVYGSMNAGMNFDPIQSYLGDWTLRIHANRAPLPRDTFGANFIYFNGGYLIDQTNKKVKFSFNWLGNNFNNDYTPIPVFELIFYGDDGNIYWYDTRTKYHADRANQWQLLDYSFYTSLDYVTPFPDSFPISSSFTPYSNDFNGYKQMSLETNVLPITGVLYVRFFGTCGINDQGMVLHTLASGSYVDIDEMELSIVDANDDYSLQIKETHRFTNLQQYSKSQPSDIYASFYTYIRNKYISGNVLYGTKYADAVVTNDMWKYALANGSTYDKLPKALFDSIARNYQRPMVIWEGDVRTDNLSFFSVIEFDGYAGKKFILMSLSINYKESICSIVAIENENSSFNHTYSYIPKYNKSTRRLQ